MMALLMVVKGVETWVEFVALGGVIVGGKAGV
jgi:hypothetical protein